MDARRGFKSLDVSAIVAPGLVALAVGWFVVSQSATKLRAQCAMPLKPSRRMNPPAIRRQTQILSLAR